ncbi:MAG: tetratricopeptide repeat-containing serine/threonine-protein kinase [Thermoanaerobaculia bacterium]|nr:tetratricopeptide repeat-containing serine/threonine-protein kinase [Thermoanaerobaculia bacterium]
MISPGTRLGPYEILASLGAGGMGEVYRAKDPRLAREVAIKVLPEDFLEGEERKIRFEREARLLAALNHPGIAAIYSFEEISSSSPGSPRHILVMELVEGEGLDEKIRSGPLPLEACLTYAAQIAEALEAAHEKGIVHRDLKPANVRVTLKGRVKLLDFGLAKGGRASAARDDTEQTVSRVSAPGLVLGTVGYMSPEQVRGLPADARSDLFSLGAVLYEMLTGQRAFRRETAAETLTAILREDPPETSSSSTRMTPAVEAVVRQCLEKDPARRFSSAASLAVRLRELLETPGAGAPPRARRKKAIDSVAVLPFVNAGGDADQDYLSDGLTERLIDTLSQLPKLRVMARSTVFRYKGRDADPLAAGRELDVRAVLTGRLRRNGDRLRVQAELVDVATGFRLWGSQHDRALEDLLEVEDAISREICEHLRFKLTRPERKRVGKQHTQNVEAYRFYLKGRFFWNKWTPDGMRAAIAFYERAIELDPSYALAWGGIADAWGVLGNIKAVPPAQAFPRAKSAALKALELDPHLSEAHASLGFVRRFFDWEWSSAEREFLDSVRLNPGYATGRRWYGQFLSGMGRHGEAVAEVRIALDLDPLSVIIHTALGDVFFYARRYDDAIGMYRKALEMDPGFVAGHSDLARALEHSGRVEEAIRSYEKAVQLAGNSTADPSIGLANAFAVGGRPREALDVLEELKRRREERYVSPWGLASIYARLGEAGAALEWLERAYDEHDSTLVWLKVHPRFDALRTDPRFTALLEKMGLG